MKLTRRGRIVILVLALTIVITAGWLATSAGYAWDGTGYSRYMDWEVPS